MHKSILIEIDNTCRSQLRHHIMFKDYKFGCRYMYNLFINGTYEDNEYLTIKIITLKLEEIFGLSEEILLKQLMGYFKINK